MITARSRQSGVAHRRMQSSHFRRLERKDRHEFERLDARLYQVCGQEHDQTNSGIVAIAERIAAELANRGSAGR